MATVVPMQTAGSDLPDFGGRTNLIARCLSKCGEIVDEHQPNLLLR